MSSIFKKIIKYPLLFCKKVIMLPVLLFKSIFKNKDKIIAVLIGLILTAGTIWCYTTNYLPVKKFIQSVDNLIYDFRLRQSVRDAKNPNQKVVIIDIDEKSLQKVGRWPWPRNILAKLVDNLFDNDAIVIAFDVLFTEKERNIAEKMLESDLKEIQLTEEKKAALIKKYDNDSILAESLGGGDIVLGILLHNEKLAPKGYLPEQFITLTEGSKPKDLNVTTVRSFTGNVDNIQEAAIFGGFLTTIRDADGVLRRTPLVIRHGDSLQPSLALEAMRLYLLADEVELKVEKLGQNHVLTKLKIGDTVDIPVSNQGHVVIPFVGKRRTFKYISAVDVLEGNITSKDIEGNIALVGTSALALADLQTTAVDATYPGVEVHATVINGMFTNKFPQKPKWAIAGNILLMFLVGVFLSITFAFLGPISITLVGLLFMCLEVSLNYYIWVNALLDIEIFLPVVQIFALISGNLLYGFLFENRRKKQLTGMFGQYVSPQIVKQMSENPEAYSFDGVSKEMTVLFADIRSFTTISETLTAAQLKDLLNRYFEPMTEIIFNTQGTIDKYVGDMIMAFWGAPKDDPNQAEHAVFSALAMMKKTAELKKPFADDGLPEVNIGIGLNTGEMNVGDMGSKYRRSYTVLGDNVNLGARLESSTKFYGADILIGENTYSKLKNYIARPIDLVKLKGKKQGIMVYQPLCHIDDSTAAIRKSLEMHLEAFELYRQKEFKKSLAIFKELQTLEPDFTTFTMFINRCEEFIIKPPPEEWDGIYTREDK